MPVMCTIETSQWMVENIIMIDSDADPASFGGRAWVAGDRIGDMVAMANADIDQEVSNVSMMLAVRNKQVSLGQTPFMSDSDYSQLVDFRDAWSALKTHPNFPRITGDIIPERIVDINLTELNNALISVLS